MRLTYSLRQAALALGVGEKHLRNLLAAGKIPFVKIGERVLIRCATLDKLLADQEQVAHKA